MKQPEFSFIIPCYKASSTIAKCIGHILDQDFKDFEIVCVLDGPDETAEQIIKSFPEVKYKVIEHGGACKARNEGFKLSTGKYVIFNDADCYWRPGILRIFHDEFIKEPTDILYGGFRWTDREGGHLPHDFDEHLLTVSNFIDTNNPVKREWVDKVGGWDESLKRWQDWDLFLRIVKAGAKGRRIAEITRDIDAPKAGNISGDDSNYISTYKVVREKNGLPNREICVVSLAAFGHALRIAKACGWDIWHEPGMLPNDYKAIYLLGMFPESVQNHAQMFFDNFTKKPRNCQYIIHWIGTDVLHMRTIMTYVQAKSIREMFKRQNTIHLFQSEQNAEEMRELGFEGTVLPLPVMNEFKRVPMPEKFTVAVYDHDGVDQKWHKWLVMELTKAMPDVEFIFFGNKNAMGSERNTTWLGRVPIQTVINKASCLLRLTVHDGYPVAPIEFLFSGRKSILNIPDMKFMNYVDIGIVDPNTVDRIPEIKQMVMREIRKVQDNPEMTSEQFTVARCHYESMLNPVTFKRRIEGMIHENKKVVA